VGNHGNLRHGTLETWYIKTRFESEPVQHILNLLSYSYQSLTNHIDSLTVTKHSVSFTSAFVLLKLYDNMNNFTHGYTIVTVSCYRTVLYLQKESS